MSRRAVRLFLLIVCLGAWAARVPAQTFEVKTHNLKNGMKILVQEDHSIPNVALYTFYRVGSRTKGPGPRGFRISSST